MTIADFPQQGTIGASLLPVRYDISIYQGDTFDAVVTFKDADGDGVDLSDMTALMQIRSTLGTIVATPSIDLNYGSVMGAVRISLDTSSLKEGAYKYDLQLTDIDGKTRTFIGGQVVITTDISE